MPGQAGIPPRHLLPARRFGRRPVLGGGLGARGGDGLRAGSGCNGKGRWSFDVCPRGGDCRAKVAEDSALAWRGGPRTARGLGAGRNSFLRRGRLAVSPSHRGWNLAAGAGLRPQLLGGDARTLDLVEIYRDGLDLDISATVIPQASVCWARISGTGRHEALSRSARHSVGSCLARENREAQAWCGRGGWAGSLQENFRTLDSPPCPGGSTNRGNIQHRIHFTKHLLREIPRSDSATVVHRCAQIHLHHLLAPPTGESRGRMRGGPPAPRANGRA